MAGDFFNPPIEMDDLPRLAREDFAPLAPNYLRAKYVGDAVFASIVFGAGLVAVAIVRSADGPVWLPALVLVTLLILVAIAAALQTLSVRHLGYLVREHDLSFRRGVIGRSTQTIPYNRVQHVGVDRGPIERMFGLATLQLRSAGGVIGIEGLAVDDANRLKDLVVARAGMDDSGSTGTTGSPPLGPGATDAPPPMGREAAPASESTADESNFGE